MKGLFKIMQKLLVKVYGLSEDEAIALLKKAKDGTTSTDEDFINETLLEDVLSLDTTRVKKLKGKEGEENELFKQGFNKAKKEVLTKLENDLREKYAIDEDKELNGIELITKIVTEKAKPNASNVKDITDDVIKQHPLYLKAEKEKEKAIKDADKRVDEKVKELTEQQTKAATLGNIKKSALAIFLKLNPVLPKNTTAAEKQKEEFANIFDKYEYEPQTDGSYLIMTGTGENRKRLEDAHGNPIKLENLVKTEAEQRFDFSVQTKKGSASNGGGAGDDTGVKKEYTFKVPTNETEFTDAIFNAKDATERGLIEEAYNASKGDA